MTEVIDTNSNFPRLNPDERKHFQGNIQEMCDSLTRIEAEKDLMKEIAEVAEEKFGIKKAEANKIAKIVYKRSLEEDRAKAEDLFDFIEINFEDMLK